MKRKLIKADRILISEHNASIDQLTDAESIMTEFYDSVYKHGTLYPILVRKIDENKYNIYSGQRRFMAMKLLGWKKIPCLLIDISDGDFAKTQLLIGTMNSQDISYAEKVKAFIELYDNYCQRSVNKLIKLFGLKQSTINRYLKLCSLPTEILFYLDVHDGKKVLTINNALDLVGIDPEKVVFLTHKIVGNNLSTSQIKNIIDKFKVVNQVDQIDSIIEQILVNDVV